MTVPFQRLWWSEGWRQGLRILRIAKTSVSNAIAVKSLDDQSSLRPKNIDLIGREIVPFLLEYIEDPYHWQRVERSAPDECR